MQSNRPRGLPRMIAGVVGVVIDCRRGGRLCGGVAAGDCGDRAAGAALVRCGLGQARPRAGGDRQLQRLPHGARRQGALPAACRCRRRSARSIRRISRPMPRPGSAAGRKHAFRRAMRSGVNRDGQHLYPTFPYDHFTNVTDEDDRGALCVPDDAAAGSRAGARQPVVVPARPALCRRGLEAAVPAPRHLSAGSAPRARNGIAAPIWSKGWRIAAPAIRRATRLGAERASAPVRRRRRRQLARLCDQRAIAGAGAVGCRRAVSPICARAGIPITASRAGRWRKWSAICRR